MDISKTEAIGGDKINTICNHARVICSNRVHSLVLPSSGGAKFNSRPFVRTVIFKITPLYDEILKIAGRPSTHHGRKHPTDQFM